MNKLNRPDQMKDQIELLLDKLTRPGYSNFSRSLSVNPPLRGGEEPTLSTAGRLRIGEGGSLSFSFFGSNGGLPWLVGPIPNASSWRSSDQEPQEEENDMPLPA